MFDSRLTGIEPKVRQYSLVNQKLIDKVTRMQQHMPLAIT
jgi:hypothetical protein